MMTKTKTARYFVEILPGVSVCILIAIGSEMLAAFMPKIGAATLSILIGILIGNITRKYTKLNKGTKFAESTLLSLSVVLLGFTVSFNTLLDLGIRGLFYIIFQMSITIISVIVIGKYLGLGIDLILLMASGNAVCGSSAIGSTAPVIQAHSRDKGIAITLVNVSGTVLMILLPLLTQAIYGNALNPTSALLGGILQSVGQVVAAGAMVSEDVKDLALIYKIVRVILLVVVAFIMAAIKKRSALKGLEQVEKEVTSETHHSRIRIPWYIIGFFIGCTLFSLSFVPFSWAKVIKEIDNSVEIVALAGIGMRVYIKDLLSQGKKVIVYCTLIGMVQIISAVILIGFLF